MAKLPKRLKHLQRRCRNGFLLQVTGTTILNCMSGQLAVVKTLLYYSTVDGALNIVVLLDRHVAWRIPIFLFYMISAVRCALLFPTQPSLLKITSRIWN